jgi:hypothetical protein
LKIRDNNPRTVEKESEIAKLKKYMQRLCVPQNGYGAQNVKNGHNTSGLLKMSTGAKRENECNSPEPPKSSEEEQNMKNGRNGPQTIKIKLGSAKREE